jgi:predicted ribosome quality control (RQC) complex YloA/Tae2 family protein
MSEAQPNQDIVEEPIGNETNAPVTNLAQPITQEEKQKIEDSKKAVEAAIAKLQTIKELLESTDDVKKEIKEAKNAAKTEIDKIMNSKGWWPFGGSKKKAKKSKRKSQKK